MSLAAGSGWKGCTNYMYIPRAQMTSIFIEGSKIPWEPKFPSFLEVITTYNPYVEGLKPPFFMGCWEFRGSCICLRGALATEVLAFRSSIEKRSRRSNNSTPANVIH